MLEPLDLLDLGLLLYIETVTQLEMMRRTRVKQKRIWSQLAVAQ